MPLVIDKGPHVSVPCFQLLRSTTLHFLGLERISDTDGPLDPELTAIA